MTNDAGQITNGDPLLQGINSYSVEDVKSELEKPDQFTKLKSKVVKVVSLYLQLLWDKHDNGKTINIKDLIENSKYLFSSKYTSDNIYFIRHIASNLREITLFFGLEKKLNLCYKNIDTKKPELQIRITLSEDITVYFSKIVHLNNKNSYDYAIKISENMKLLSYELIIPDNLEDYLEEKTFESIFEDIAIMYIFNFYQIFCLYLYNEENDI